LVVVLALMMETLLLAMVVLAEAVAQILVLPHQVKAMLAVLEQELLQRLRLEAVAVRVRLALHFLVKLLVAVA